MSQKSRFRQKPVHDQLFACSLSILRKLVTDRRRVCRQQTAAAVIAQPGFLLYFDIFSFIAMFAPSSSPQVCLRLTCASCATLFCTLQKMQAHLIGIRYGSQGKYYKKMTILLSVGRPGRGPAPWPDTQAGQTARLTTERCSARVSWSSV